MGLRSNRTFNQSDWRRRHSELIDELLAMYSRPDCELTIRDIAIHMILFTQALEYVNEKVKKL